MQLDHLPLPLSDWPLVLSDSPYWQLSDGLLQSTTTPQRRAWLVLFGRALDASHLIRLAPLLAAHSLVATLYPPTEIAGVPLLLLGCDEFVPTLVAKLKAQTWGIDLCHLSALPTLSEPGLLVMDMDSTAICIECIDEMAHLAGVGAQVAALTRAAMTGKLAFADSLRQRVALLAGAPVTLLDEVATNMPWMPGLALMVDTLKAAGWKVAIASGGFTRFARQLQQALGLDAIFANELTILHGRLTGALHGPIVDASVKAQILQQLAAEYGVPLAQTVAIGDGANDLAMLAVAGLGIAIHGKPQVQAHAAATLNHHNLEGVVCLLLAASCQDTRWDERKSEPVSKQ
ncbi:MAG: phosphoserine phosphatase SerB [Aeromonas sp.]